MKESQYVTQIINEINKLGGKAIKFVETEYSSKGEPDIIGTLLGAFVVEAKLKGNTTSKIQEQRLNEWAEAGAVTLVATYPQHSARFVAESIYNFTFMDYYGSRTWEDWQTDFEAVAASNAGNRIP